MTTTQLKQDTLLDELLQGCTDPKDILGEHGLRGENSAANKRQ